MSNIIKSIVSLFSTTPAPVAVQRPGKPNQTATDSLVNRSLQNNLSKKDISNLPAHRQMAVMPHRAHYDKLNPHTTHGIKETLIKANGKTVTIHYCPTAPRLLNDVRFAQRSLTNTPKTRVDAYSSKPVAELRSKEFASPVEASSSVSVTKTHAELSPSLPSFSSDPVALVADQLNGVAVSVEVAAHALNSLQPSPIQPTPKAERLSNDSKEDDVDGRQTPSPILEVPSQTAQDLQPQTPSSQEKPTAAVSADSPYASLDVDSSSPYSSSNLNSLFETPKGNQAEDELPPADDVSVSEGTRTPRSSAPSSPRSNRGSAILEAPPVMDSIEEAEDDETVTSTEATKPAVSSRAHGKHPKDRHVRFAEQPQVFPASSPNNDSSLSLKPNAVAPGSPYDLPAANVLTNVLTADKDSPFFGNPYFNLSVDSSGSRFDQGEDIPLADDNASVSAGTTTPRSIASSSPKSRRGSARSSEILETPPVSNMNPIEEDEEEPADVVYLRTSRRLPPPRTSFSVSEFSNEPLNEEERQDYIRSLEKEIDAVKVSDQFSDETARENRIKDLQDSIKYTLNPVSYVKDLLAADRSKRTHIFKDSEIGKEESPYKAAMFGKRGHKQNAEGYFDSKWLPLQDPRKLVRSGKLILPRNQFDLDRYLKQNPKKLEIVRTLKRPADFVRYLRNWKTEQEKSKMLSKAPQIPTQSGINVEIPRIFRNSMLPQNLGSIKPKGGIKIESTAGSIFSWEKHFEDTAATNGKSTRKVMESREKFRKNLYKQHVTIRTAENNAYGSMSEPNDELVFKDESEKRAYLALTLYERALCFALPLNIQHLYFTLKTAEERQEFIETFSERDECDTDECIMLFNEYIKAALSLDSDDRMRLSGLEEETPEDIANEPAAES